MVRKLSLRVMVKHTDKAVATPAIFYSHWKLEILNNVLLQKSKAVARVNTSQKVQFDEYSVTLSKRFGCRTCSWLDEQHSGFTIDAYAKDGGPEVV